MTKSDPGRQLKPKLHQGEYVFCVISDLTSVPRSETLMEFKTEKGISVIIERGQADKLRLTYTYIASWITLETCSSLEEIGLTALFSRALAKNGVSCNVVAGCYHDHIFVDKSKETLAMSVLNSIHDSD